MGGIFLIDAARKTDWASEPRIELHLLEPREVYEPWRKFFAGSVAFIIVIVIAIVGWPKSPKKSGTDYVLTSPPPSVAQPPAGATPANPKGIPSPKIVPPASVPKGVPSPTPSKEQKTPKKLPEPEPPTTPLLSPDPYAGISDSTVAGWVVQEANALEDLGTRCVQDEIVAHQRQNQGLTPSADHPGVQGVQARFWRDFIPSHKEAIVKLHDSIVYRLGPVATSSFESEYSKLL
jgi:hypothetical protein